MLNGAVVVSLPPENVTGAAVGVKVAVTVTLTVLVTVTVLVGMFVTVTVDAAAQADKSSGNMAIIVTANRLIIPIS